jgi:sugar lactone lactonase YvrE
MDWNTGAVSDADNKRALTGGAALPPLAIVTQSAGQVVVAGGNATFTVTATEASPLTYRWQRQAAGTSPWINLTDNSTYSGSTTASLTVASITAVMNGDSFQCIVTGGGASVTTSPAMLVVNMPMAAVTLAGQAGVSGQVDGAGSAARFSSPADVAFDAAGNLYVADTGNHTVRKIDKTGTVSTFAGQAGVGGSTDGSTSARFNRPSGLAVGATGNVYVADTDNSTIRMISTAGVVTTLVGCAGAAGSSDGTGTAAGFSGPSGIAVAATGDLYVSDTLNDTIRMVTSAGVVTTIAGVAGASGLLDGVGSAARFHGPQGLVLDSNGNLFVADTNNNAIRRIVLASGTVTTVAGQSGAAGDEDGAVTRAQFHFPSGIGVDAAGNLYIADTDNNALRQIAPSGAVNTPAGLAGSSGSVDGVGTAARFFLPTGVTVSAAGDVYMADTNNHTIRLAVIPSPPAITTQPQSQTVAAGSSAQFSVTASGRPAVTYQWNFNGTPINGATSSSFSLSSAQSGNAGSYTVVVSNVMGNVTSTFVTLTVSQNNPPTTIPQGGGGGGGGGAPSDWFYCALLLMVVTRICQRRPKVDRPADIEPK